MQTRVLNVDKYKKRQVSAFDDELAVEDFLEIYVNGAPYAMTMRMPGDDINLVRGYCFTEGLIESNEDIESITHCSDKEERVLVKLKREHRKDSYAKKTREYFSQSSCGMCGKTSLEEVFLNIDPVSKTDIMSPEDILSLQKILESKMILFPRTGCTHAASIFSADKDLLAFAEDVGRHNALDKSIGYVLEQNLLQRSFLGIVSSRLSFEMVQKAGRLGLEIFAGVSAATTMAVQLAKDLNITLIGFLRNDRMNIYTHSERLLI